MICWEGEGKEEETPKHSIELNYIGLAVNRLEYQQTAEEISYELINRITRLIKAIVFSIESKFPESLNLSALYLAIH